MTVTFRADSPTSVRKFRKRTAEITRCLVDFSHWLDDGEAIGSLSQFSLAIVDEPLATAWQVDYPFGPTETPVFVDTTPLILTGATTVGSTKASILLGAGTPGGAYVVSFIATGNTSGRQKEIDFYLTVDPMVNENMISSLDPTPTQSVTVITATTAMAVNTNGLVFVRNGTAAAITVTLPPSPVLGQTLNTTDDLGNAGTYTITFQGAAGALIGGDATFRFTADNQAAEFVWGGTQWAVT